MELFVLSGENCAACTTLKNLLNRESIPFTEVDFYSDEGMELAADIGARSLPAVKVVNGLVTNRFTGKDAQDLDLIKQAI